MKFVEEILAKVLGIDAGKINDQTGPANTAEWDSFNGLILVTELEKNFNVKFTLDEVVAVKNVADIRIALKKHGIEIK